MRLHSLVCFVLIAGMASRLSAEELHFDGDAGVHSLAEPVQKSFVWSKNLTTAIAEAEKLDVPLVIVFGNTNSVLTTNYLVELGADGLKEFADKAVFVHVAIPSSDAEWDDPLAMKMVQELNLKVSPTILVMSPNPFVLIEGFRIEGIVEISELKSQLDRGLACAVSPDKTWRQPTIEGIVKQLSDAMHNGDLLMYTACMSEPVRSTMKRWMTQQIAIGNSKRRLLAALDARFGVQVDRLSVIEDDDVVAAELRKVTHVRLLDVVTEGERIEITVLFTRQNQPGEISQSERRITLVKEEHGFRMESMPGESWSESANQLVSQMAPLIADLDRIADGVASGMFPNASSALELAKSAYQQRTSTTATVSK
ncbi:hypothetical protein K2Y11_23910 [bacterium]|nr:hypothetical protein [bacterium]